MNQFDDFYRIRRGQPEYWQTCEAIGEHQGDTVQGVAADGCTAIETWSCCGEVEVMGEYFDCDTCLEPGITPIGNAMPPGWVEDTNGHHCPRCQPGGTP